MAVRFRVVIAAVAALIPLVAACASSSSSSGDAHGRIRVVASTDVYGDIAATIAGDHGDVTSFIDEPDQDPHSYEANARNQLAVGKADLIIENGGGYDDFVDRLRSASDTRAAVVNVVKLSGKTASAGGELNEHVWYDLPTVAKLAGQLATSFAALQPDHAAQFRANARSFTAGLSTLERTEAQVKAAAGGAGVAITEPVPLYLLQACGLVNRTPAAFSEAVEEGTDVSAAVLNETLGLFRAHTVSALVYNAQTSGPETTKVIAAAKAAGIATVAVTETLPADTHYLTWMRANLAAVRAAVAK